ncbi:MAG: methionine biosynthesis protein MetW [Rhodospirillales bacterium]|jgi:methionine biosynthesis protein MetW|nr:methionine biosynthesis protein MetW [Rhodospirillales bacterium]MBT4006746.1 methionine biosynthesis protein MetW [Rhodospirillales bacterium]MBT5076615.1 methionine biosynthesis protein MetW [Rhodospirillales bacterium]MBT5114024.1 methionine biosynthesis protein MetW [Rhodospirillales bacterium]MBT5672552.1 methionine biosynthesis protein MetW [Rhodospirillales bacterium]
MTTPDTIKTSRVDHQLIASLVPTGARVLDVGCGDGALLYHLRHTRGADARGIEINRDRVSVCLDQGLSVIQGDAEVDLRDYPSDAFDCVVLSQTLQAVHDPKAMLETLLRIGRHAVIAIPNSGYWRNRMNFAFCGRVPFGKGGEESWHNTANIHPCTIKDFVALADEMNITIERCFSVRASGSHRETSPTSPLANLFAIQAVFLIG